MSEEIFKTYPHAPPHLFIPGAVYFITASTYHSVHHLKSDERKRQWRQSLDHVLQREHWLLDAWVVLNNHYHILLHAPEASAQRLPNMIRDMHKFLANDWNTCDKTPGRMVWHNYWDTCLRDDRSYYTRLNYIHWNPIKHGLVANPEDYPLSSYRAYLTEQESDLRQWEKEYPWGGIKVEDDF